MYKALFLAAFAAAALAACQPASDTGAPPPSTESAPAPAAPAAEPKLIPLAVKGPDGADLVGDATKGKRVFVQCQSCHSLEAGRNQVGPSLHAILGRTAGTVEDFAYTPANQKSGITWTEQELYDYLEDPRAKIPGTNMAFVGLKPSQQRADLIAYLKDSAS